MRPNIKWPKWQNKTLLMYIAHTSYKPLRDYVYTKRPYTHAKTGAGETALYWAIRYGSKDTVAELLDLGIDASAKNDQGLTAEDQAKAFFEGLNKTTIIYSPSLQRLEATLQFLKRRKTINDQAAKSAIDIVISIDPVLTHISPLSEMIVQNK